MEHAMAELPLAIFTTLAPISAGSFIALAIAFLTTKFAPEQLKKIDRMTWIPLAVLVVAFIAAFFHLTQALNAVNVFAGVGRSPMSNEIVVGVVFFVVALVYCVLGTVGKLSEGLRKGLSVVVAVVGLVFALTVGMAYMIETIVSWNTPLVPVTVLGFSLLGGGLMGLSILALGDGMKEATGSAFKPAMYFVLALGAALAVGAFAAHAFSVQDLSTFVVSGAALVAEVLPFIIAAIVCLVVGLGCGLIALAKNNGVALPALGLIVVIVGVFLARLVFYALQVSVGL